MTASGLSLVELQRQMAAAIMAPLTDEEGMREKDDRGRSMQEIAESFVAPNSRLSAFERLEIYNRQYWFRVLGALSEDFITLRSLLGDRSFEALSIAYLNACPSRSFTLRNLGSRLPEWLADHLEYAGRRAALAVDVARVEWAFIEAFDLAASIPLTAEEVGSLSGDSKLALQPHVQLLALYHPSDTLVHSLHQQERQPRGEAGHAAETSKRAHTISTRVRRRATWLAVHRAELSVYFRRLQQEEYLALDAIQRGMTLSEVLASCFEHSHVAPQRKIEQIQQWFSTWTELGWLCSAERKEE